MANGLNHQYLRTRLYRICDGTAKAESIARDFVTRMDHKNAEWWMSRYTWLADKINDGAAVEEQHFCEQVEALKDGVSLNGSVDVHVKVNMELLRLGVKREFDPRGVWDISELGDP